MKVEGLPIGGLAGAIDRMVFKTRDERTLVQVGRDFVIVNSIERHLGWANLRGKVLSVLATYCDIAKPASIAMAEVRYLNRVEIKLDPEFALDRYFTVLPHVPAGVPSSVKTFLIHNEVDYQEPPASLRIRFGTTNSEPDVAAFLLDYEHIGRDTDAPSFADLPAWLDAGHARIERAFYGSFTAMAHKVLFGEIAG